MDKFIAFPWSTENIKLLMRCNSVVFAGKETRFECFWILLSWDERGNYLSTTSSMSQLIPIHMIGHRKLHLSLMKDNQQTFCSLPRGISVINFYQSSEVLFSRHTDVKTDDNTRSLVFAFSVFWSLSVTIMGCGNARK